MSPQGPNIAPIAWLPPELGGEAFGPITQLNSLAWNLLPWEALGNPNLSSLAQEGPFTGII